jgi:hypothetical protein
MVTFHTGNTAFIAAQHRPAPPGIMAPNSADFDAFSQLVCPDGILDGRMRGVGG